MVRAATLFSPRAPRSLGARGGPRAVAIPPSLVGKQALYFGTRIHVVQVKSIKAVPTVGTFDMRT